MTKAASQRCSTCAPGLEASNMEASSGGPNYAPRIVRTEPNRRPGSPASEERRMDLFAITISITDGKGHVVLADQAHGEASSCRVELRFPLGIKPGQGFSDREEQVIRDARAVLAAALVALDRR